MLSTNILTIKDSSFENGRALQGGAISILGDSIITISSTQFLGNQAYLFGGAISADSYNAITIDSQTKFVNNEGQVSGGDALHLQNAFMGKITILDSSFTSRIQSNFMYIQAADRLSLTNVKVEHSISKPMQPNYNKSSGVYLSNLLELSIQNSSFRYLQGTNQAGGGAIFMEESDSMKTGGQLKR